MIRYGLLVFFACIPFLAFTQEVAEVAPPKFPLSLRAPENATWTITAEQKQQPAAAEGKSAPSFLTQLVVTKTAPIYMEKGSVKNGKSFEKWIFSTDTETFRVVRYAGDSQLTRMRESAYADISRYGKSDFEDVEWISKSNYQGVEMLDEKPAYMFSAQSTSPLLTRQPPAEIDYAAITDEMDIPTQTYSYRAWIDAKTLLPLKFESDDEVRTYTYGSAPTSRLSPPGDVLAFLKEWIEQSKMESR